MLRSNHRGIRRTPGMIDVEGSPSVNSQSKPSSVEGSPSTGWFFCARSAVRFLGIGSRHDARRRGKRCRIEGSGEEKRQQRRRGEKVARWRSCGRESRAFG